MMISVILEAINKSSKSYVFIGHWEILLQIIQQLHIKYCTYWIVCFVGEQSQVHSTFLLLLLLPLFLHYYPIPTTHQAHHYYISSLSLFLMWWLLTPSSCRHHHGLPPPPCNVIQPHPFSQLAHSFHFVRYLLLCLDLYLLWLGWHRLCPATSDCQLCQSYVFFFRADYYFQFESCYILSSCPFLISYAHILCFSYVVRFRFWNLGAFHV